MKKLFTVILLFALRFPGHAQLGEAEQLLLNLEKLSQLKSILQNMYDGYQVLSKGYSTIKNISEGNFSLHKAFLDALLEVSPVVKQYWKITDIVSTQAAIIREYKKAWSDFKNNRALSAKEVSYIGKVYANLLDKSRDCLEDLFPVITSGTLRMSDEERLSAIDRIFKQVQEQAAFLKTFNNSTALLCLQRKKESADTKALQQLHNAQ